RVFPLPPSRQLAATRDQRWASRTATSQGTLRQRAESRPPQQGASALEQRSCVNPAAKPLREDRVRRSTPTATPPTSSSSAVPSKRLPVLRLGAARARRAQLDSPMEVPFLRPSRCRTSSNPRHPRRCDRASVDRDRQPFVDDCVSNSLLCHAPHRP